MATVKDMFDSVDVDSGGEEESSRRVMDRVQDGTYKAVVSDFSVFNTATGDFFVSWWFEVTDGAASGAQLQSFSGVSPFSVKFIKRSVQRVTGSYPEWSDMFNEETGRTNEITRGLIVGSPCPAHSEDEQQERQGLRERLHRQAPERFSIEGCRALD